MKKKKLKIISIITLCVIITILVLSLWYVTYGTTTTYTVGENAEATFNSVTGELTVRSTSGVGEISIASANSFANLDYHIGRENVKTITFANKIYGPTTHGRYFDGFLEGYSNLTAINNLNYLDTSNITDMSDMFSGCKSLTSLDLSKFNTSNVTNMESMFSGCSSLTSINVSTFNTSNVTNMQRMFGSCESLTSLDLNNFDTSNVTDMYYMFGSCESLTSLDLSNFNTSNVTNMSSMFNYCNSLTSLDLSNFNTSKVTNMASMFFRCNNLTSLDISSFNTLNVTNMSSMFSWCENLTSLDVSKFNTSNVTYIERMFDFCSKLTSINVSNFDTSNVISMREMFNYCSSLTSLDLSNFDTSKVTSMYNMFKECENLTNVDVSSFNTSKVTNMYSMFYNCKSLTSLNMSNFDMSNVTSTDSIFIRCDNLNDIYTPKNYHETNKINLYNYYYNYSNGLDSKAYINIGKEDFELPVHLKKGYGIIYNANGGTGNMDVQLKKPGISANIAENSFTAPENKTFKCWGTSYSGGAKYDPGYEYTIDKNLTLYAQWEESTYTVTLNTNEGTIVEGKEVESYIYGIGATLPKKAEIAEGVVTVPAEVTKPGYAFEGWYENSSFTGTEVTSISTTETGNKTYYAKWLVDTDGDGIPDERDPETLVNYTVEHYKQNLAQDGYDTPERETKQGNLGTIVTAVAKEYTGFIENTSYGSRVPSGTVVVDGSLILKLYYDRNTYTVTLNTNEGTIATGKEVESYIYGIGATLPKKAEIAEGVVTVPAEVTKAGYAFEGWYEDSSFTGEAVTAISTTATEDKTYYAKWLVDTDGDGIPDDDDTETLVNYTVEHYKQNLAQNGYDTPEQETKQGNLGTNVTATAKTYTGFSENETTTNRVPSGTVVVDGSLTLKLYYDRNTYTVTLNTNEGTIAEGKEVANYTYGVGATLPKKAEIAEGVVTVPAEVTKAGYAFEGWYEDSSFIGAEVTSIDTTATEDKTYYAKWLVDTDGDGIPDERDPETLVNYTVEHYRQNLAQDGYDAPERETKQGNLGTTVTAVAKDYTGFSENEEAQGRAPSGTVVEDGSLTLKLYYDRESYDINYILDSGEITDERYAENYIYGIGATLPTKARKTGYAFEGWYKEEDFSGTQVTSIGIAETGDKTYYAKFLVDTDGDEIPDERDPETLVNYTVEHYKQNLAQDGYDALERETKQGNLGTTVTAVAKDYTGFRVTQTDDTVASGTVAVDGSLTLKLYYNRESYDINYMLNGGAIATGKEVENYTYGIGATLSKKAEIADGVVTVPAEVTKAGYAFGGWYVESDYSGEAVTQIGIEETGDKTYYAKWLVDTDGDGIPDDDDTETLVNYTVEHYKQNLAQDGYDTPEQETKQGNLGSRVVAVAKGYAGFSENEEAQGRVAEGTVTQDGTLVLKLYYDRESYDITYMLDEGTINDTSYAQNYTYGIGANLPTNVTKQGYTFRGWYEDSSYTGDAKTSISATETGAKTYYARWTADGNTTYTVEYYKENLTQNGYDLAETKTINSTTGTSVTATAESYIGFTENELASQRVVTGIVKADGSLTLKLYYNREIYDIRYELDGGTINESNYATKYKYGISMILPTNVTKPGYVFRGWYEDSSCTGEAITSINTTATGDKTYYAKWLIDTDGDGIPDEEDSETMVNYIVKHYKQIGITNQYKAEEVENLIGAVGSRVTAVAREYEGYVENTTVIERVPEGIVSIDGKLELKLFYDTIKHSVIFKDGEEVVETQVVAEGTAATAPNLTKEGYTLSWDKSFENVNSDLEVNAIWTKIELGNKEYKIEHYIPTNEGYELKEVEQMQGKIGESVTATLKEYEAYVFDEENQNNITTGIVSENEELVLKVYYKIRKITVIFKDGDNVIDTQVVDYGTKSTPPTVTKPGYIANWKEQGSENTDEKIYILEWVKDPNYKDPNQNDNNSNNNNNNNNNTVPEKPSKLPQTGEKMVGAAGVVLVPVVSASLVETVIFYRRYQKAKKLALLKNKLMKFFS